MGRKIIRLEGLAGLREIIEVDSALFPDNELQVSNNVEINSLGRLDVRKGTEALNTFATDLDKGVTLVEDIHSDYYTADTGITINDGANSAEADGSQVTALDLTYNDYTFYPSKQYVSFTVTGRTAGGVTPYFGSHAGTKVSENTTSSQEIDIPDGISGSFKLEFDSDFDGTVTLVSVKPYVYSLIRRFWVWYPLTQPEMETNYTLNKSWLMLLWVSNDDEQGEIYLAYYVNNASGTDAWELMNDGQPLFWNQLAPTVAISPNLGAIISTGRTGSAIKSVNINPDGELIYGDIGLPAQKEITSTSNEEGDNQFATDSDTDIGMGIPRGSIVQTCYTVITKDGSESNPSPIETHTNWQWQDKGEEDGGGTYTYDKVLHGYWKTRLVENIIIDLSSVTGNISETVESINVYRRDVGYSESSDGFGAFTLIGTIPISEGQTEFVYNDTSPDSATELTYENDTACKGEDIATIGNQIFVANANSKIKFPGNFDYYCPISIANNNSRNYVNAIIAFKIFDKDSTESDKVTTFDLSDYFDGSGDFLDTASKAKIRIYDIDLTTPCRVVYQDCDVSTGSITVLVEIPYMTANTTHTLYLVWGATEDTNLLTGINYGEFDKIDSGYGTAQVFFNKPRIRDDDQIYNTDWTLERENNLFENRCADLMSIQAASGYTTETLNKSSLQSMFLFSVDSNYQLMKLPGYALGDLGGNTANFHMVCSRYSYPQVGVDRDIKDKRWTMLFGKYKLDATASRDNYLFGYVDVDATPDFYGWYLAINSDDKKIYFVYQNYDPNISAAPVRLAMSTALSITTSDTFYMNLFWSAEMDTLGTNNLKIYLYVKYMKTTDSTPTIISEELTGDLDDHWASLLEYFRFGNPKYNTASNLTVDLIKFDTQYIDFIEHNFNDYISDDFTISQIMNLMPYFRTANIGLDVSGDNENITFGDTKEIEFNDPEGILRWGSTSFPDLQYIRLPEHIVKLIPIPSPSQLQHQNTLLVMSRNMLRRFVLAGDPNEWAGGVMDNMIDEQSHLAPTDPMSIQKIGNEIFYKSEQGIMRYGFGEMMPVCLSTDNIDVGDLSSETHLALYVPSKNQLWFYGNTDDANGDVMVYDLKRRKFLSRFSGLNIEWFDTIDEGFDGQNQTVLLLNDDETYSLKLYPSGDNTTETPKIVTKRLNFGLKARLRRFKINYTGSLTFKIRVYNPYFSAGYIEKSYTDSDIDSEKWVGLPSSYNGNKFEFELSEFTTFKYIDIEYIERGE